MRKTTKVAAVAVAGLLLTTGCGEGTKKPAADVSTTEVVTGSHEVVLEANGSGKADVAYSIAGDQAQTTGVALPWSKSVKADLGPDTISMMAVLPAAGDLSCRILVDGKVTNEAKADPGSASVTCRVN
jgi:hypothetical protein